MWSLLNDCSKKIQCGSERTEAGSAVYTVPPRVCVCQCACVCAGLPCHGRGSTSVRYAAVSGVVTLSQLLRGLGRFCDFLCFFFVFVFLFPVLTEPLSGWERMRSAAAAAAGASPT